MTHRPGAARWLALLPGLAGTGATAACLALASHPDGTALAQLSLPHAAFAVTYVHSVTRTPVVELYRVDGTTIVEVEMRFAQPGPGLPTEADAGHAFVQRDGQLVVSMARRLPEIVMRVHRDQSPRITVDGRDVDLAAWGNRAIAVRAASCTAS
ncbi:MAG: DUF1850 domain-containing protein [Burkholderiales bacterium]